MRLFLAVFPPPAVREAIHAAARPLREAASGVSWVQPGNLHYTMRFLGEVGEDGARRAGDAALEAAASRPRFEARAGAFGAFPSARRARVIWIGLEEGAEALTGLARALDGTLERRGFGAPDKRFTPHLTLGRVREPQADWSELLSRPPALDHGLSRFAVERLSVVVSQLSPKGSIYTVRAEAPLAG